MTPTSKLRVGLRCHITTPAGRTHAGQWPKNMPNTGEGPYIAALGERVRGACEVALPLGRADVATDEDVFEVEPVRSWRSGARQVLAYAAQTGLRPNLALFGEAEYLPIYRFLRDRVSDVIRLWVWRGYWEPTNGTSAVIKGGLTALPPHPNPPPQPVVEPFTPSARALIAHRNARRAARGDRI